MYSSNFSSDAIGTISFNMGTVELFLIFGSLFVTQIYFLEASYQCGIRKHSFVQLVHRGWKVEEGQWPWHVAMFHKTGKSSREYACGGSLLDQKHILTAGHCVLNRDTQYPLSPASIELHFGQQNLSKTTDHTQIRDVSKVHVHPEYSTHRNDLAVLVIRLPVEFTDFVIPICMDQRADRDLRNLEGQRGWITGWGTTQSGSVSDVLRTASMPVVSYLQCFNDDQTLFGNILNPNVFCAGDRNGTSPGTGDSGGGMYFSEGDRWVLRGIVSFAKADELKAEVDTSKYAVFVNVQRFLTWIKEIIDESEPTAKRPKRISEQECDRFMSLTKKRSNGLCANSRYPHTVSLIYSDGDVKCSGILVNENHVITACHCRWDSENQRPVKVQIDAYGDVDVLKMTCHPLYTRRIVYHDLAVIKLDRSIDLSSSLIPACLASNWTENLYDTLLQTGFGKSSFSGIKKFIESDDNQVITKEECERLLPKSPRTPNGVLPAQLCVINKDNLRTSSSGSSGSPLQSANSRTCMNTIVGVTSFGNMDHEGIREQNVTVIDVYTRVSHYLDWIEQEVWDEEPTMTSASTTTTSSTTTTTITSAPSSIIDFVFPDD